MDALKNNWKKLGVTITGRKNIPYTGSAIGWIHWETDQWIWR